MALKPAFPHRNLHALLEQADDGALYSCVNFLADEYGSSFATDADIATMRSRPSYARGTLASSSYEKEINAFLSGYVAGSPLTV